MLGKFVSLISCFLIPNERFLAVLQNANPRVVCFGNFALRSAVPDFCGLHKPTKSLLSVLSNAFTIPIQITNVALSFCNSWQDYYSKFFRRICSLNIPLQRFLHVNIYSIPHIIFNPQTPFSLSFTCVILYCVQSNINNPVKAGEGLDLGG